MANDSKFIKGVERLVDPIEVGTIHFLYGLNKLLPIKLQNYLSEQSSKQYPYMGFVVEPYSNFLFYEIKDIDRAKSLLPEGFELIKTKVLKDDAPRSYGVFGAFRVHTSAFWGSRLEFYVIAKNISTGLLSWIIVDYDSNTIGQDKKYGLRGPSAGDSVITINHRGTVYVDFDNKLESRKLAYDFDVEKGVMKELDPRLWIEGNLSVTYGKNLNGSVEDIFSLQFELCEMEKALVIPKREFKLNINSWYPGLLADAPAVILCFPYAQHFLSDSPGHKSNIKNADELKRNISNIDFEKVKPLSVKALRDLVLMQNIITAALFVSVIILLFLLSK